MTPIEASLRPLAVARAAKEPLPGPLASAFATQQDITVGPFKVRPVVAYDYIVLKEIGSPLYEQIFASGESGAEDFTMEQACELCYLFTTPIAKVRKQLRMSRDEFAEAAIAKFFDVPEHLKLVKEVLAAAATQMKESISTMQAYVSATEEGKADEVNFTPATVASPKTDLAGSSATSAGSGSSPESR